MSRVLIGIGAAILLAGIAFAIVHFSSRPQLAASTPKTGWVPVTGSVLPARSAVHVAGTFGAWRLLCRGNASDESLAKAPALGNPTGASNVGRCGVALVMRRLGTQKAWLNLRFVKLRDGVTTIAMLAYSNPGAPFVAQKHSPGAEVDLRADKVALPLTIRHCSRIACVAIGPLTGLGVDSMLAAHALVIQLTPAKPDKTNEVHLPIDGLNAAFAALRRPPA